MRGMEHCWKTGFLMSGGSALELTRASTGKLAVFVPCIRMETRSASLCKIDMIMTDKRCSASQMLCSSSDC